MTIQSELNEIFFTKYNIDLSNIIPSNDITAWDIYPKYRYIYNKMFIMDFQNIDNKPVPIEPKTFPVVIKPIINLRGMGINSFLIKDLDEYHKHIDTNHFWSKCIFGRHYSWDIIINKGEIFYYCCFEGVKDENNFGAFKYWKLLGDEDSEKPPLIKNAEKLIKKKLNKFTGCLNLESIEDTIIEAHLRMGDIDQSPKKIIYLIYLNYLNDKITELGFKNLLIDRNKLKNEFKKLDEIKLKPIFLFPTWQVITNKDINEMNKTYQYLNKWEKIFDEDENIIHYYLDDVEHSYPGNTKRWFLFTTNNFNHGIEIKNKIEQELILLNNHSNEKII